MGHRPLRNAETVGRYNTPGAPDIVGSNINYMDIGMAHEGRDAFMSRVDTANKKLDDAGTETYNSSFLSFYASRSSGIYGASDTVMPASADISMGLYLGRTA